MPQPQCSAISLVGPSPHARGEPPEAACLRTWQLPQWAWPWQRGIRYKSCACWQLGSSPVLVAPCGAGRVGPGGPHGASSLPCLQALGKALHTALLAGSESFCLCVVRVVTVTKPPATWPSVWPGWRLRHPWPRQGSLKCVEAAVGVGWAQMEGVPTPRPSPQFKAHALTPGLPAPQQLTGPSEPTAQPEAIRGPPSLLTLGHHIGGHTAEADAICLQHTPNLVLLSRTSESEAPTPPAPLLFPSHSLQCLTLPLPHPLTLPKAWTPRPPL